MRFRPAICFISLSLLLSSAAAQNIMPDPGFESTGIAGEAHSGKKAGYIRVGDKVHWRALDVPLKVEPFATYKVSGWVKATVSTGRLVALHGYAWNSFDWRFGCGVPIKKGTDWKHVETSFVSPDETFNFSPLAFYDAADSEAWIDDVVVEKVKPPVETMTPLTTKAALSNEEIQLLARYYVSIGKRPRLNDLLGRTTDRYTIADLYCLLAKTAPSDDERRRCLLKMIEYGAPAYANGFTRIEELLKTPEERTEVAKELVSSHPGSAASAWGYYVLAKCDFEESKKAGNTAAEKAMLEQALAAARRAAEDCPQKVSRFARFRENIAALTGRIEDALASVEERRKQLGSCEVTIEGTPLTAENYTIVIGRDASRSEQHAATELQKYIEKISGRVVPIKSDDDDIGTRMILVGNSSKLKELGLDIDFDDLGDEGFVMKTAGGNLVLAGGRKRGTLYSVYTFLEEYLGCGWFIPGPMCEVTPREGRFKIGKLDDRQKPSFEWRALSSVYDVEWQVKNKLDPTIRGSGAGEERGDPPVFHSYCHIFDRLIPPAKYFVPHPEYVSLVKGRRRWNGAQICTTNPDVIKICADQICQWMDEHPECRIFSICQDDGGGWCECEDCKALDTREGCVSDRLVVFFNAVARKVYEKHPDKLIYTLAYSAGIDPPLREKHIEKNIMVQICHIRYPCCHVHPIETCPKNAEYKAQVEAWAALAPILYVYDYRVDYNNYLMPYPNCYAIARDVPYYKKVGVKGIFYQGGGAALNHGMCHYLLAKLMWNHKADVKKLTDRFFERYFGRAAKPMKKYWKLLHDRVWNEDIHICLYTRPPEELFTADVLAKADEFFDEAEGAAENDLIRERVRLERLPLYWVKLYMYASGEGDRGGKVNISLDGDTLRLTREEPPDWRRDLARFIEIARKNKVTQIRENSSMGGKYIEGFVERVIGCRVHGDSEYRYLRGAEAHGGSGCIYVRGNRPGYHGGWQSHHSVVLAPDTKYKFSAWVKFNNIKDGEVSCLVLSGPARVAGPTITESCDWRLVETTFVTPDVTPLAGGVRPVVLKNEGEVWVDDVRIAPVEDPDRNIAPNPGFEASRGAEPVQWIHPSRRDFSWTEHPPISEFLQNPAGYVFKKSIYPAEHKVVTVENDKIALKLIPSLGGRIYEMVDKETGLNFTHTPDVLRSQGDWLEYGGYEEYSTNDFASPGWREPYECEVSRDGERLVARLSAKLPNGYSITRTIRITNGSKSIEIESVLKNDSDKSRRSRLRVHPILAVGGDGSGDLLYVTTAVNKAREVVLPEGKRHVAFERMDLPVGMWMLVDKKKNAALLNYFRPDEVEVCYFFRVPGVSCNLELWSRYANLAPGESLKVRHRYVLESDARKVLRKYGAGED